MIKDQSVETILALDCLEKNLLAPGALCSYETLTAAINMNAQTDGYTYVKTARRQFERKHECVLEAIPNEGIRWLEPRQVINRGARDMKHVRVSTSHAWRRQTTLVPVERQKALTNEERIKFNQQLSVIGVLRHMTKPAQVKKIESASDQAQKALPVGDTLALFAG